MFFPLPLLLLSVAAAQVSARSNSTALETHIQNAERAQSREDCTTAAKEYAEAVKLLPRSGELRANLGIALYCGNQFEEAKAVLQKSLQLKPELSAPHLFLGLSAVHLSDTVTALQELQIATRLMPDDPTAHLWLGYVYLSEHDSVKAIRQFDDVLQVSPDNVDARYALGQTYFQIGRQKALDLEKIAPGGRGIRDLAAHQSQLAGEPERSVAQSSRGWISAQEQQLYEEALEAETKAHEALQTVIATAPRSDRAHQIQGDAYSLKRENDEAIAEYEAVLKVNPTLPGVRLAMANCMMQSNRFQEALEALLQEQAIQPRSADVLASIGRVQQALGNNAGALISLKQAMTLPHPPPAARLLLGKTLLRVGDAAAAVPQLEQSIKEGADASTANYLLARAYKAVGNKEGMQRALDAYHHHSLDEAERQAANALVRDPKAVRTDMTSQELQDANSISASPQ